MTDSVLRPYFHTGMAGMLASVPGLGIVESVAGPMQALSQRVLRDPALLRALESELDEAVAASELSAFLAGLATRLADPQAGAMPPWIRVAQETRDWLPFSRLPLVADRLIAALGEGLSAPQASFAHGYVSDALRAIDVFSQRFTAGQEASQFAEEVGRRFQALRTGEAAASGDRVDAEQLVEAVAAVVGDWARCSTDMGVVVDLEFLRLFIDRLLVPFRLSEEDWVELVLSVDAALAGRAGDRPDHVLRNAIDALLDLRPMLGFFRDLADAAPLYLPADAQDWGQMSVLLALAGAEASGELSRRIAESVNLARVAADFGPREAELLQGVRLGAQGLRREWERNFIDHYTGAADLLARWGRASVAPLSPEMALADRLAVTGRDARERRVVARALLAQLAPDRHAAIISACRDVDTALAEDGVAITATVTQVAEELAALPATAPQKLAVQALAARLQQRADLLLRMYGPTTVGADLCSQLAVLAVEFEEQMLASLARDVEAALAGSAAPDGHLLLDAVRRQQAAQALKAAMPTVLGGLVEAAVQRGLGDPRVGAYAELLLRQVVRVLGGRCESPRETLLRLLNHLRLVRLSVRGAEQRPLHELLAERVIAALGEGLGAQVARLLDYAASRSTGIDLRRARAWNRIDEFVPLNEYGPLWVSVFGARRLQTPHHAALSELLDDLDASSPATAAVISCWKVYGTAWTRLGDPFAAWSAALHALSNQFAVHDPRELREAWLVSGETLSAGVDPSLAAFVSVLLAEGLDRLNRGHAARRLRDWAQTSLGATLADLGRAELRPSLMDIFDMEATEAVSVRAGLAPLNLARFIVERVLPVSNLDGAAWVAIWTGVHEAAHASFECSVDRLLAARQLGRYAAICREAESLNKASAALLLGADPIYADDPAEEANWRALVSGLLACTLLRSIDASLCEELALSTPLLDRGGLALWGQRMQALRTVFESQLPRPLAATVQQVVAGVDAAIARSSNIAAAEACSGLDCAVTLRAGHPASEQCWRLDRLVRSRLEGLTSPMPGDLTIGKASGWALVEGLGLRRAARTLADTRQFLGDIGDGPSDVLAARALPLIAARSAFLRDGLPTPALRTQVASLLSQHWSALADEPSLSGFDGVRQRLLEEFGQDSGLFERFAEYSQCAAGMAEALSRSEALRSALPEWLHGLAPTAMDQADDDPPFMAAAG